MSDLALRRGRLPLEVVRQDVELLAVERRGDLVLGDEHLLARLKALCEVIERDPHLGADVGDDVRVEHERLARAAERIERADLDRRERRRCVAGVVTHRQDCIHCGRGSPDAGIRARYSRSVMKHPWLAYLVVSLLAIGAGVVIAGLPDNSPAAATVAPPTIATTTTTEVPDPTTTAAPTTVPETTEPETTEPETTEPETTEPETSEPETTDSVPEELPERGDLIVVAANGANVAGAALRMATLLEEFGYVDVAPLNGTDIVEFTVVYYADGFEEAAQRLAEDLDLLAEFVAPLEDAPEVADIPDGVELLVYIGRDRA